MSSAMQEGLKWRCKACGERNFDHYENCVSCGLARPPPPAAHMHARELAEAQHDALATQQAAAGLRQAEAERKARGLVARLRAALRGE